MPERAREEVVVAASPAMCFGIAADFEEYPTWATDVKQVRVLARDPVGRGSEVEFRVSALGRTVHYVLAYDFTDAPRAFTWSLVEGDLLRSLDGRYAFAPVAAGTLVTYDLGVDLTMPLPAPIRRRAAGMIVGTALQGLKRVAEAGR